jgi:hypothetical protein
MQVKRLCMNSHPSYTGHNTSAQLAADSDDYRTAVSRACSSQSVVTIGPHKYLPRQQPLLIRGGSRTKNPGRIRDGSETDPLSRSIPALQSTINGMMVLGAFFHGREVGSSTFATELFTSRLEVVKSCIFTLTTSIHDEQTKLKLFSMMRLIQKLPHLLASDILSPPYRPPITSVD